MDARDDRAAPPPEPPPPLPPRRRRRIAVRVVAGLLVLALLLVAGAFSLGWWAVRDARGTAWLLSVLPGVQVEAPKGTLIGDFSARRLAFEIPGGKDRVTIAEPAWRGLALALGQGPRRLHVSIESMSARRIDVALAATPTKDKAPLQTPTDLRLPVELELRSLKVGELYATPLGATPLRELDAALHLGANGGAEHRIGHLTLRFDRLALDARATVAADAPMALDASVNLTQAAAEALPAWAAAATLAGPLERPLLNATLRASPSAGKPAQTLDLRATLKPFAPWPLADLAGSASALDLSAFSSAAPSTALTLQARAASTAADQPASLTLDVQNALAGRWSEARLPLGRLSMEVAARPDRPNDIELRAFTADLGTPTSNAGRVSATGQWSPERWRLEARIAALQPARLDARAPAMQLDGPLTIAGSAAAAGRPPLIDVKADLAGRSFEGARGRPVGLQLDATLGPGQLEVRAMTASAGAARASLSGTAVQSADGASWAVKATSALAEFDPAVWWPGGGDAAWRRAPNKLNAKLAVDLAVPSAIGTQALPEILAALRGQLELGINRSVLAGVPLNGNVSLRSAPDAQAVAVARLEADGNSVRIDGRVATRGNGERDAWEITVDGSALQRLAPVFKLFSPAGADATLAGTLRAKAQVNGRWPTLRTQGELDARAVRVGAFGVQQAQARWTAGTALTDPVDVQATLAQLTMAQPAARPGPPPSIESAELRVTGSARAHTLELRAASRARPPAWAEALASTGSTAVVQPGATAQPSLSTALVRAQGGVVDLPGAAAAGWRGVLQQVELRGSGAAARPLLQARDLAFESFWAGGPARVSAQPGRIELLGGALRWSRLAWQAPEAGGGAARIDLDAQLEPLRVVPLLAIAQPDSGWGGDLVIAGRMKVQSAPQFKADVLIERRAGDLTVTNELGSRALDLTDLKLALNADDGVWNLTTGLAGKSIGVATGAVVVRTTPQALWPAPEAPVEGVLEVRVADLAGLGSWVPPGWRVGGALRASASLGGRFSAPQYTGEVSGSGLSVRNFLEGVNVRDGEVAIRLEGTSARIERFTAKGGDGSLRIDGTAAFGEAPRAELRLSADKFLLLGRIDRRIVASGSGTLRLDARSLAFDGRFGVDEGLIDFSRGDAPALSEDVRVIRAPGAVSPAAAASAAASPVVSPVASTVAAASPPPTPRDVALDLRVNLGDKLALRGRGLDARLAGELHLTSPAGKLAANGDVRVVDGTYQAYGQKLVIDRGVVSFTGPIDRPRLDIEATRPKLENIRVGVAITGSAANPRVRLFSEPELSEVDKLSWLVMGRASDNLGRTESALLQRAALALVSGEGPGLTDKVTKALGLDELSLSQADGDVKQTVLSLGKQLSDRWYLGYAQGLNATAGSFQLIYRIAQRFTVRAQSGEDNSVDFIWTWRWQ